ncbi:uncharacterized protein F4822DRAFT_59716 [Hypoxylon trugodes]|uniref:uncharacterized protein n=1 Tax=Hypoxylon trugodes TaxID=326681 RepID=UPI002195C09B|nr:uncharacterized protein F4822DRAFT_59716 [Hypoxylon trugodes]KAI1384062.1 hypothetical protein F4822DRAFT_59716 [Hypoxylon trugodes]
MPRVFAFGSDPFDPTHRFETSWLIPPWLLFTLRASFSLYAFTTLFFTLGYQCAHADIGGCWEARASFSYFTVLTYWGLAFYLLFSSIHTLSYILSPTSTPLLNTWPRPLQALHALFYSTVTTYPFLVTIVYWGVLYPYGSSWFPTQYLAWGAISEHALNSFFALFEILIPRTTPQPWIHALWCIIILALYLALAYVTKASEGFYTYDFLDPGKTGKLVAAYVFGIGAAAVIVFGIVWCVVWARRWITEEKLGRRGVFAKGKARVGDMEAHELGGLGRFANK